MQRRTESLSDPKLEAQVVRYVLTHGFAARRLNGLRPRDLTSPDRAEMLHAIQSVADTGEQVTVEAVVQLMTRRGRASAARDVQKFLAKTSEIEGIAHATPILKDLAKRRRVVEPLVRLSLAAEDGDLAQVYADIRKLSHELDAADAFESGSTSYDTAGMVAATMEEYQARQKRPPMDLGLLTPLARELLPGSMVVVGGRSGAGKSQCSLMMGRRWWATTGARIGIVSLEDRAHVWGDRVLAMNTEVSLLGGRRTPHGNVVGLTNDDWENTARAAGELKHENAYHLEVMDRADISDVERAMNRCVRAGCGLLIVDYVQEIRDRSAGRGVPQHERYSNIAARIKMVAKRARLPLILCSQVARPQRGSNAEPSMTDLKGSGDIENMAEAIVLLWKEQEDSIDTMAKVVKLKNGSERPRVLLTRNGGGMITGIEAAARRGGYADRVGAL